MDEDVELYLESFEYRLQSLEIPDDRWAKRPTGQRVLDALNVADRSKVKNFCLLQCQGTSRDEGASTKERAGTDHCPVLCSATWPVDTVDGQRASLCLSLQRKLPWSKQSWLFPTRAGCTYDLSNLSQSPSL